ncbi:glycoside hydrolase family 65 protein [Sporolactobacillus sp. THM7-4]|nr:glycoside hydrolase family 65 protein [Sporolactobacillus sp. THM7-4]
MTWEIADSQLTNKQLLINESLFSLGNGYLGVRGNFEEGYPGTYQTIRGTYINAFHDVTDVHYEEKAFAYPETKQKLLNVIDAQGIAIFLGEEQERFSLFEGDVISFERKLHLDSGFSERIIKWRSPGGKEIEMTFRRIVSFIHRELFAMEVTLNPLNFKGPVTLISTVRGDVKNFTDKNDSRVSSGNDKRLNVIEAVQQDDYSVVVDRTLVSNLEVACVSSLKPFISCAKSVEISGCSVSTVLTFTLDKPVSFVKRNVYTDTLRHRDNLVQQGITIQRQIEGLSFEDLLAEQDQYMTMFWRTADVEIEGDDRIQEGIRFNMFHLLQSAGRDSVSNIAAKGLSGEGYEGHYFWDSEIFMFPFFLLSKPDLARHMLLYRYSILDKARERAKEMGHRKGALFAWRTISGSECSPFFPAGTAQYHINADIAYSYVQYFLATDDIEFMKRYGLEVLVETARLWTDVGHYFHHQFRIDDVTGPDEYTAIVNNNYYTNLMARHNLRWAVKVYHMLKEKDGTDFSELSERLHLSEQEAAEWLKAAESIYLPYDATLKINPQDDTFLQKAVWDFDHTPKDHYPLLLHYHPLTLYRYQVCKQADTVLAHFLLEDEQSLDTIRHSYHYYEKITTHDSSLSSCIYGIMASKLGEQEKACRYFTESARLDLDNTQGNTKDGLHMANMGGTWMGVVFGFAGVRIKETGLSLSPTLPESWKRYAFHMHYRDQILYLEISGAKVTCTLVEGHHLDVKIYDKDITLTEGKSVSFDIPA